MSLAPFAWKDRPALIESLFPVQKISIESFKEQMSNQGKTLTALGSYWKGRKPLILNKACVLGCLLPATDDPVKDLEIFELLMGMDRRALVKRLEEKNDKNSRFFLTDNGNLVMGEGATYRDWVNSAKRPEECDGKQLFSHIWAQVNKHLGTEAQSFPELIEQMGIARFGHRPRVADVFSGSGQIPFEAARLGCDVYASDLNPIACVLTWGAFNIVGASPEKRMELETQQQELAKKVQAEIDALGIEEDGKGWRAKTFLYCVEARCPETGWMVPLIPSLIVSKGYKVIAKLVPIPAKKCYDIEIEYVTKDSEVNAAAIGTVVGGEMVHSPDGVTTCRTKISTLRGDYREDGENKNRLRLWEKSDFIPRPDDVFQERLYCIQWMKRKPKGKNFDYEFRSVTPEDLKRERKVIDYVGSHLAVWQEKGYVPDMRIEPGYNTDQPIRERGWTHWHQLFNSRQLLVNGLINRFSDIAQLRLGVNQAANWNSKLSSWDGSPGVDTTHQTFYNQALNTLLNYGTRSSLSIKKPVELRCKSFPIKSNLIVTNSTASDFEIPCDIFITDPPYGDAVKYEEIVTIQPEKSVPREKKRLYYENYGLG